MAKILYLYNIAILKNDKYKKIVVTFPGTTTYIQIIDELYDEELVELPIKDGKQSYYVMKNYYNIFKRIEKDLFNSLEPLTKDPDYQVIFTGHSIGGVMASLASFYYIKKYNYTSKNILITFGQPKVGNIIFAKELTNIMNGQIYRIARPYDIATLFPIKEIDYLYKSRKIFNMVLKISDFVVKLVDGNYYGVFKDAYNFIKNFKTISKETLNLYQHMTSNDFFYSHSGGLYMINDEDNTIYHCDDFYNEKRDHFICKNHNLEISWTIITDFTENFFTNRNYLTLDQDIMSGCQKRKLIIFRKVEKIDWESIIFTRRLENINNNNINHNIININTNNNKGIRKLNNIEDIQILKLFEEFNFKKNKFEYYFKYESKDILKNKNLFLIINPRNNYFFGEVCLTPNITWLIKEQFENINCYFVNTLNQLTLAIILNKEIINEKELYIYIKGKIHGTLELYDLTKNKTLNINSSYCIPYIIDFPSENSLKLILPKIKEDTYINLIFYDGNFDDNITNITSSSILEIYKDNKIIDYYNNSNIILEKNSEYYFKYHPDLFQLIINIIPIYSNKFLEKVFYIIDEQNIHINYNIESVGVNQTFGLFFDFEEIINIKGFFSNKIDHNTNNVNSYTLNTNNKYFHVTKKLSRYNYYILDVKLESQFISELIIYDIQEVIIINKIESKYEIKKNKNYLFLLNETLKNNYKKVETYTVISINNDNNFIKLISIDDEIKTSKNYLMAKLNYIVSIFIQTNEDDTFMIKLISEDLTKYLNEESTSNDVYSYIDDKKFSIDFIHNNKDIYAYYNPISPTLKIYELNNGSNIELNDIINNKNNKYKYSLLSGIKLLEEKKTHMILKKSSNPFLYENYIYNLIIELNYRLYESKICYLFMDFEYEFSYNIKIKNILMKVLNKDKNNKNDIIYFYCNNEIKALENDIHILDVEKCNGTFVMLGNNSLIYFYLPHTVMNSYDIIENKDNFELNNIYHFFFVPKKNEFNSINILLTIENEDTLDPAFLTYYIDYGIIPYSRNIERRLIIFKKEANLVISNYANNSKDNETYFIYFRFNTTLSKLNAKIIYENIIYLDDQTYIILEPGINIIKFVRNIDHYLNITKFYKKKEDRSSYTIYKDDKILEHNNINDTDNIIYIKEPAYRENIKIKIENNVKILVRVSTEKFEDFSVISYDTNVDIRQIENILNIKFNTTNYKSRLEYHIALIENQESIEPLIIHQKFYDNDLIYKKTIYSSGKESIETNLSLLNNTYNFTYNKDYTLIAYGKDFFGNSINYFYMDPVSLYISAPNSSTINQNNTIIKNSNIPEISNSDNSVIGPVISTTKDNSESTSITSTTPITSMEKTDDPDENIPNISFYKKDDDTKANIIAIVLACIGVVLLGGIMGYIIYYKTKVSNIVNITTAASCTNLKN